MQPEHVTPRPELRISTMESGIRSRPETLQRRAGEAGSDWPGDSFPFRGSFDQVPGLTHQQMRNHLIVPFSAIGLSHVRFHKLDAWASVARASSPG